MGFISWIANKFTSDTPVAFTILISKKDGKGLLLRRGPTAPYAPGLWNFPGGHLDKGESAIMAARRECQEETGITPQSLTLLGPKNGYITYFRGYTDNTQVKLGTNWGILENDDYVWIPFEDIFKYKLSEYDMVHYWHLAFGKEPPKPKSVGVDATTTKVLTAKYLNCVDILRKHAGTNPKFANYASNIEAKIPALQRAIEKNKHDIVFWEKLGTVPIPELQPIVKSIIAFWRRRIMQGPQSLLPQMPEPIDTTTMNTQYRTFADYMKDKNRRW